MTRMLVVVRSAEDAVRAIEGGADRLAARPKHADPAVAQSSFEAIVSAAAGRCPVALWRRAEMPDGVDVSAFDEIIVDPLEGARPHHAGPFTAVLPLINDDSATAIENAAAQGASAVLLGDDAGPRLFIEAGAIGRLATLVKEARSRQLAIGFGGTMETPDIPRLLAIAPDFLAFNALVRDGDKPDGPIDAGRIRLVRQLIPHHHEAQNRDRQTATVAVGHDRIFVRDWTVAIHVGAYAHEHAAQRVRFTVEVEVMRVADRAADLRDVVTYDLITDAISRATTEHVDLVETLAEDVAAAILTHTRVVSVDITVEKLDLGPGALGCRMVRRRTFPASAGQP